MPKLAVKLRGFPHSIALQHRQVKNLHRASPVPSHETESAVVNALIAAIEQIFDARCKGIGIGVPGLLDADRGIVHDVISIPSWKEVHLKEKLESRFNKPVFINNDSNCFVLGEKYYGKGRKYKHLVGITLRTGLGAGIIVDHKLYNGHNCGAGEFGSIPYKGGILEDYCSGRFFKNEYKTDGSVQFAQDHIHQGIRTRSP